MRIEEYCDITEGALRLREKLQRYQHGEIVTHNPGVLQQLALLEQVSKSNAPITIVGEKGTGKEVVAQYAHNCSANRRGPFLKTNCARLPEERMHTELFGSVNGRETGLLRRASGGSLYIENADLLPTHLQNKLMDHILGSNMAETRYMVSLQNARDVFSRLSERMRSYFHTVIFELPPLRKRPEDILLMTFYQLKRIEEEYRIVRTVSPEVMEAILEYDWPANTRELAQTLERMAFLCDDTLLDSVRLFKRCLSPSRQLQSLAMEPAAPPEPKSLKEMVQAYEVMVIQQHIEQYGSLRKAAAVLKTSPATLSRKLTGQGLPPEKNAE